MMIRTQDWDESSGNRRRLAVWTGAAALMLLPVLAIRGVEPAAWDPPGDFMFLFILLAGIGLVYELAARASDRSAFRIAAGIAVIAASLHVWINLAVGIIGSENNSANWIYVGVLAVAAAGAVLVRFRPLGMYRAMIATAAAQAMTFVIALVAGLGFTGPITIFFIALWLMSAWLFRRADRERRAAARSAEN